MWGSEGIAPPLLASALKGCEWSASGPGCFTPWERAAGTHWFGGWVGPSAGLDAVEYRTLSCPYRELNPLKPAAILTELSQL
jgi:hypothetical protein